MSGPVVRTQTVEAHASHEPRCAAAGSTIRRRAKGGRTTPSRYGRAPEAPFGIALVDCRGNLLGAGTAGGLAGEVEVPPGVDLRREDLSSFLDGDLAAAGGRRFPLVSAIWVQVKSRQVRVGIYMESGERLVNPERLDLDLGRIAAILSTQVVA